MEDKLTIENLAALLAAKMNMEQADADAFVCSFFALIEEGLKRDKYVKIKGLGTFKLITEADNEGKVVFIPDAALKEAVNKPFSHFQPVELNEGVHFDDIDENESSEVGEVVTPSEPEPDVASEQSDIANVADPDAENIPLNVAPEAPEPCEEKEEIPTENTEGKQRRWFMSWYMFAAVLLAGVVIGVGVMWGVFAGRSNDSVERSNDLKQYEEKPVSVVPVDSVDTEISDSIETAEEDNAEDTVVVHKKAIDSIIGVATDDVSEIKYLSDEVVYKISGTLDTVTIVKGSTLSKVAYKYFRNRKLWPYIVMYNKDVIDDPNNVPIGTTLRIPKLTPAD